jgi:hypothetical protein
MKMAVFAYVAEGSRIIEEEIRSSRKKTVPAKYCLCTTMKSIRSSKFSDKHQTRTYHISKSELHLSLTDSAPYIPSSFLFPAAHRSSHNPKFLIMRIPLISRNNNTLSLLKPQLFIKPNYLTSNNPYLRPLLISELANLFHKI